MLKQMEQRLMYWEQYNELLKKCIDSTSVAHVCALIKALLHQVTLEPVVLQDPTPNFSQTLQNWQCQSLDPEPGR